MNKRVFITGIGCVLGNRFQEDGKYYSIAEGQYEDIIARRRLNALDRISKQCIAAAELAFMDANLKEERIPEDCGIFFGTAFGPISSIHKFDTVSVEKGALFVNPSHFPNTVLNSPACRTGIEFAIAGPVYTICNGITSTLDALGLGYCHVKNNITSLVIAGGVDEVSELQLKTYDSHNTIVEGCGFAVLESEEYMEDKNNVYEILGYDTFSVLKEDTHQICRELSDRIGELVKSLDLQSDVIFFSIYSCLASETVEKILEEIKQYFNNPIKYKLVTEDFIGAGGIVQLFDLMKNSENTRGLNILLNMDEGKATMLLLSKYIK
ncbi:beta-ketoacyl synthase N-terminal-like domain-containing protein [Alkaliphilus peptidifermentans]|uniref:Beta-ketoacyl synthase, N-terminal domain n=1 Tax=Alkaliphilus peptidifermentans DSM 18978 TaxID=1120976 RepID=A0A1G5I4P8_9FIRM|nr:beta-ketoacyl synthase N-terminal-like domain-containing protein [Alkaliphilus peptidifermentans]SCY70298.1 Beta-ketoacyl synthase, N-terminal domain [Alkaliphilus peptidifermentans DSM 18978]